IVSAASYGYLQPVRLRELQCGRHIERAGAACNHRGQPIDQRIEAATCRLVSVAIWANDLATHRLAQLAQVHGSHVMCLSIRVQLRAPTSVADHALPSRSPP